MNRLRIPLLGVTIALALGVAGLAGWVKADSPASAAPLSQSDVALEAMKACCVQAGGVVLRVGQPNPKDGFAIFGAIYREYCGLYRWEYDAYYTCVENCWPNCMMNCCAEGGGLWETEAQWSSRPKTDGRSIFFPVGDSGFGCSTTTAGQEAWGQCYQRCAPLDFGGTGDSVQPPLTAIPTPTPMDCTITLTAIPDYVLPGGTSRIVLQAVRANGQPVANAKVNYDVGSGGGSVGGGLSITDAQGRLEFEYVAPPDIGNATKAMVEATVDGCTTMASVQINFGPTPTPSSTPTITPTEEPATPTPTLGPTATPTTPTPTPKVPPGELSLREIVVLQAVQGGDLVGGRDVGVRVFLNWTGAQSAQVEVRAKIDDLEQPPVTGTVTSAPSAVDLRSGTDAVNLVLDWQQTPPLQASPYWDLFPRTMDANHRLEIEVRLVSVGGVPVSPPRTLPVAVREFQTRGTTDLGLLFVKTDPRVELSRFAGRAINFLRRVYPVFGVHSVSWGERVEQKSEATTAMNVERARRLYNDQRCRDESGNPISPCRGSWARFAVGVFKDYAFEQCVEGFLYGRGGRSWKDFGARLRYGPLVDRAPCVSDGNPHNTAHEIGHSFDRKDEYNGSVGIPILAGTSTWSGGGRFQTQDGKCYNFMGNASTPGCCSGCVVAKCTWVNADTWNAILRGLRGGQASESQPVASLGWVGFPTLEGEVEEIEGPALLVAGTADQQGGAVIRFVDKVQRFESWSPVPGEWTLEALDAQGTVLSSIPFSIVLSEDDQEIPFLATLAVEDPARVAEVRLLREGQVISKVDRSPSPPTVSFDALPDFEQSPATVSWRAEDPDGDPLRSTLLQSSDGGQTWRMLAMDLEATSLEVDPAELPGGEARLRVIVSDGLNEAQATSDPVSLPDRAPQVFIDLPWGDTFNAGEGVSLEGYAHDLEDGDLPEEQLRWKDAGSQVVGEGWLLYLEGLAPGEHRLVLTAEDSTGKTGEAAVTITVLPAVEEETSTAVAVDEGLMWMLLGAAGCGWVVVIVGLAVIVVVARGRPWFKPVLLVLIVLGVLLSAGLVVLGLRAWDAGMLGPEAARPGAQATTEGGEPTAFAVKSPEPVASPTLPAPAGTPAETAAPLPTPTPRPTPPMLPASWDFELVDAGPYVGPYSSLALDTMGRPHISYDYYTEAGGSPDHNLRFASKESDVWSIETVDTGTVVGWFTSMALDADEQPHISYYDAYHGFLKYARYDGSEWHLAEIDKDTRVGFYTSLALDSADNPHIIYWDPDNAELQYLHFTEVQEGSPWVGGVVEGGDQVGEYNSLALDSSDHPHLVYYDRTNGDLRYAYNDGSSWFWYLVDAAGDVGVDASLALDSADRPHVAYHDVDNEDLKYAYFDGSAWHAETVDAPGNVGRSTSIVLDAGGHPHISYYDLDNRVLKYAVHDGAVWQIGIVGDIGDINGREETSLALDDTGRPHVSYFTEEGLKYARAADAP